MPGRSLSRAPARSAPDWLLAPLQLQPAQSLSPRQPPGAALGREPARKPARWWPRALVEAPIRPEWMARLQRLALGAAPQRVGSLLSAREDFPLLRSWVGVRLAARMK